MTSPNDDSAKVAAVRGVLGAFDWEHDDRQRALEEIERIVTADEGTRAGFIAGLRELADYLESHPAVPVPQYTHVVNVFPDGDGNAGRRAAVDRAAALLGTETIERGYGHYLAERTFGRTKYCVVAIDEPQAAPVGLGEEPAAA